LPAVELVGVFLARFMKIKANVGIDSNAEIIVHNKDLSVVLIRVRLIHVNRDRDLPLGVVKLFVLV
jgi:hypothetical protein